MAAGSFDLDEENTLHVLVQRPQRAVQNWQDWSGALEFAQLFQLTRLVSHNSLQFRRPLFKSSLILLFLGLCSTLCYALVNTVLIRSLSPRCCSVGFAMCFLLHLL